MKGVRPGDLAWANGRFLPRESLSLSVGDAGFVLGATVTEQLRTFRGELFLPGPHRDRLAASLETVGIETGFSLDVVMAAAAEVARYNHAHVGDGDLGVVIFVTPGDPPSQHEGQAPTSRASLSGALLCSRCLSHAGPFMRRFAAAFTTFWPIGRRMPLSPVHGP